MLALPDSDQLRRLSAFDGDSDAAWRLHGGLLRELYGEVASALVLRADTAPPRLVALTTADGQVRIDAQDPFDARGAALALADTDSSALFRIRDPQRVELADDGSQGLLARLLAQPVAVALPLHAGGRSELLLLLGCARTHPLADAPLALLGLLANCLSAHLRSALDRRELVAASQRAHHEIRDLADVQRLLLPDDPRIRGLQWAVHYQPAKIAGGDYYDLMPLSHLFDGYPPDLADAFGLMLADVSGHGAGAAMEAVQFDAILRTYSGGEGVGPAGALSYANRHFFSRKARPHFMTVLGLLHDPRRGEMLVCNAGHLPPLRRRAGVVERLDGGRDIPLGILREHRYDNHACEARAGDWLLAWTDGITEARDAGGQQFGEERLWAIFERSAAPTPDALLAEVVAAVHAHQGGDTGVDDQTLIVLRLG